MFETWAIVQTFKVLGSATAGGLVAIGTWLAAQADLPNDIPELVGGITILSASFFIVRWVLHTSKAVEEKWIAEISRLENKADKLEKEKDLIQLEADQWRTKYWELWAQYHGERRS